MNNGAGDGMYGPGVAHLVKLILPKLRTNTIMSFFNTTMNPASRSLNTGKLLFF